MRKTTTGLILTTFVFFLSCLRGTDETVGSEPIRFQKAVLDLSNFTFRETSMVELSGEWELYFGEFHYPPFHGKKDLTGYLAIPKSWQGEEFSGKELPRLGNATLRAFIKINKETIGQELRIYIPDIASSYRFFANGILIGGQGKPGINHFDDTPKIKPEYYTLIPESEMIELVFHIANYNNNFGGFWSVPILGNKYALDREKMVSHARELFLLGALTIIGMYHLGLYFYRRREKSIFYFAVFCFLLGVRVAFTGERYLLELFPSFHWPTAFRLEFATYYFAIPSFLLFISKLFPDETNPKVIRIVLILSTFFALTLFFTYINFYTTPLWFPIRCLFFSGLCDPYQPKSSSHKKTKFQTFFSGTHCICFCSLYGYHRA